MSHDARACSACVLLGVLMFEATACHKGALGSSEKKSLAPKGDASTESVADAAAADARRTSLFVVVAHSGNNVRVDRISGSPALAVDSDASVVWELNADGTVRLIEPLAESVTMKELAPSGNGPFRIGRVAGRWPIMQLEFGAPKGSDGFDVHTWAVDASKGTAERTKTPYGHVASSSPWIDGIELAWASGDSSLYARGSTAMNGDFVVLTGPPRPLPKVPKDLRAVTPFVAAYESGRVFLLGGVELPTDERYEKVVWSFQGRDAKPMALPGAARHMVRGRREEETLVAGARQQDRPFLARFDGSGWVDVPLPFANLVRAIATGDDGSVWIVSGPSSQGGPKTDSGELWRASFPDLRFTSVPLPPKVAPISVAATSERDVWVVAADPSSEEGTSLLHTQATSVSNVQSLPRGPADLARIWYARRGPSPFTPTCIFPFLALGRETELNDADVKAFAIASDPSWFVPGVLVRTPSGERLFGFELGDQTLYAPTRGQVSSYANLLTKAQSRWSGAKLSCARLPIERTIEVHRPRARRPPPPPKPRP